MQFKVLPYKLASRSAKTIASALSTELIDPRGSPSEWFQYGNSEPITILNWGNGWSHADRIREMRHNASVKVINTPKAISKSVDKRHAFTFMQSNGVPIPTWTTNRDTVRGWFDISPFAMVLCRTPDGRDGQGIEVIRRGETIIGAPLYTLYQPVRREFRVHCHRWGEALIVERKRNRDAGPVEEPIFRTGTDWTMHWPNTLRPSQKESLISTANLAREALGLDFCGVDIGLIHNDEDAPIVFETNTAPGDLGPKTKAFYARMIESAHSQ